VVIVGAGPAGLAAAATLRAHRIDAVLLERGQSLGEPWRARYDRLHLHTIRWLSDLPGYRIPTDFGLEPGCIRTPLSRPPATAPVLSHSSAMSHKSDRTASQARKPAFISSASAYRSPVYCTKSPRTRSGWQVKSPRTERGP